MIRVAWFLLALFEFLPLLLYYYCCCYCLWFVLFLWYCFSCYRLLSLSFIFVAETGNAIADMTITTFLYYVYNHQSFLVQLTSLLRIFGQLLIVRGWLASPGRVTHWKRFIGLGRRGERARAAVLATGDWVSFEPSGEHEGNQCASVWRARCCTNEFRVLFLRIVLAYCFLVFYLRLGNGGCGLDFSLYISWFYFICFNSWLSLPLAISIEE